VERCRVAKESAEVASKGCVKKRGKRPGVGGRTGR